ncbi:MAG: aminotransferase class V-fold PLP-dependent enzyme, partial [Gemmataceae bacterium]
TPAIEAVVGLGAAVEYLQAIGLDRVEAHGRALRALARERLRQIPGVRVLGDTGVEGLSGPLSFTAGGALSHMVARTLSDAWGVCVRSGYHCAQPLHEELRSPPSVRLSFYVYNQPWEIDRAAEAIARTVRA